MTLTGLESTLLGLVVVLLAGILGFFVGGYGRVSKKECVGKHEMEAICFKNIETSVARIEVKLEALESSASAEDRDLHGRITTLSNQVSEMTGMLKQLVAVIQKNGGQST